MLDGGSSLKVPGETLQKSGGSAPGRDKVLLITVCWDCFLRQDHPAPAEFLGLGGAPCLCKEQDLSCLLSVLVLASVAEGGYCFVSNTPHTKHTIVCQDTADYYGSIPGKGVCIKKLSEGFLFAQMFYY